MEDLGYKVSNPKYKINGGNKSEKTCNEGRGVLGLGVANYSVDTANDPAEEYDKENLRDLGKALECRGKRILRSHCLSPFV